MRTVTHKIIWKSLGFFPIGVLLAFSFEGEYRRLVRFLFTLFSGNEIGFYGKHIHLFAHPGMVVAFGLFCSFSYLFLIYCCPPNKRFLHSAITLLLLAVSLGMVTALHSKKLIVECTRCEDGKRMLTFNEPNYNTYFLFSLLVALVYLFISCRIEHKKQREKENGQGS